MKNKFLVGFMTIGLAAVLFTSCSKVPQVEIDAAKAAVEEAKTAGAELYVQSNFIALQDSLNSVMEVIEAQKSKFFKNYGSSKEQLVKVALLAQEVKQQTETRKEEIKVEIQTLLTEVKTLVETNKQLILEAPKGKEGTSALVAIKAELDAIETTLNESNIMFEAGDLLGSHGKVKAAKIQATSINTELNDVIAKYKSNVKGKSKKA